MSQPVRTVVHVIRHGEVHNPNGILYGTAPGFVLSARGEQMASAAANYLAGCDIQAVVASPLERAQQTAYPVASQQGLPIATDERLIEAWNFFAGRTVTRSDLYRHFYKLYNPFRPSWGEPYRHIAARMTAAVANLRRHAAGREAVVVSHQLPIWTLRLSLQGRRLWHDPRNRECALGSITSLRFDDDKLAWVDYHVPAPELVAAALAEDQEKKRLVKR